MFLYIVSKFERAAAFVSHWPRTSQASYRKGIFSVVVLFFFPLLLSYCESGFYENPYLFFGISDGEDSVVITAVNLRSGILRACNFRSTYPSLW